MTNLIPPASLGQPQVFLAVGLASKGRCSGGTQSGAQSSKKQKRNSALSVDVSPHPILRDESLKLPVNLIPHLPVTHKEDLLGAPTPPNPERSIYFPTEKHDPQFGVADYHLGPLTLNCKPLQFMLKATNR